MSSWLTIVMNTGLQSEIHEHDMALLVNICEALSFYDMDNDIIATSNSHTLTADVHDALVDTWSELLGSRLWVVSN